MADLSFGFQSREGVKGFRQRRVVVETVQIQNINDIHLQSLL